MGHLFRFVSLAVLMCAAAGAHVGSPDIYLDGTAGPYKLFVTIRPPQVIPGVAEILVRNQNAGVTEMKAVPLPMFGPGANHPPTPDVMSRSATDPQFFTGSLWLMADGSWQVRIFVKGTRGDGTISIPVPAVAQTTRRMDLPLGILLSAIGLTLMAALAAIAGATVREAKLDGSQVPGVLQERKGRIAMAVGFVVIGAVLWTGKLWWDGEADVYKGRVFKPLNMQASLEDGSQLVLDLSEPGWMQPLPAGQVARQNRVMFVRKMDDLTIDHNHLMHLYAIREPGMDVVYHLHPDQAQPEEFRDALPPMPPGTYKLYADIVHENGLPETLTASLDLPHGISSGRPLSGDDAQVAATPIQTGMLGDTFALPDGYRMRWIHDGETIHARQGAEFQFELLTPDGKKPADMALYMGMLGHAAFVKTDGTVFAHIHPNGTVSMSAFMRAQADQGDMAMMDHSQMDMSIPNRVAFPYGLPSAGRYRVFVQMKHGNTVETGVFDLMAN